MKENHAYMAATACMWLAQLNHKLLHVCVCLSTAEGMGGCSGSSSSSSSSNSATATTLLSTKSYGLLMLSMAE